MQLIRISHQVAAILIAAVFAVALAGCSEPTADGGWAGTYKTQDTQGNPMEITLSEDGSASGKHADESLSGSWKEENGAVMITWGDEWTTKIAKEGDKYTKTAYKDGSQSGESVAAEKVK
jgi:hypothetical protein